MILAGAEGAFMAAQSGISHAEYIKDLTARLDAVAAKFLEDENKRLGIPPPKIRSAAR